ncbi:hypothetical protein [Streptomyces spectabilis]|uniref:Aromatic ring-opening dioxygenase LigA n=1 Tax=Streptomyces spectabilis TaxID=68270 RepID=A0A5P2X7U1_STRST|nr:hypothetical protein [Streptomyces spectabilis]MBB5108558.1 hypothetical protein [Streptomyces spectabilis]MCI3901773.1 hypothetical protein [Streptomyces spectabilis]QEV59205.1 hypothetical protein CP982_11065 [Streptomyces spectabilis]GGV47207.1 hypothetical protein GCM10010245_74090 [Streptomyces spectabilis]
MTQLLAPAPGPTASDRPTGARRALRAVAVVSCLPYLSLKAAWIAGSRVGIPEGSALLDHRGVMIAANTLTVLMDAAVIVLALLLTRPWGHRVPAWLLALPMWAATGLLAPIMAGFPAQLAVRALGGSVNSAEDTGREPFLDEWVFGVVYGGFILQGLSLGLLFALYARDRWGRVWRGRVAGLADPGRAARRCALAAAVLALYPAALRLLWAGGSTLGLNEARAAERTSDFSVLQALEACYLAAAAAGALVLAFRWGRALPVRVPLALAWLGSAAVACWGAWLFLASLGPVDDVAERPTAAMLLSYAVQMIIGTLVATVGVRLFKERAGGGGAA